MRETKLFLNYPKLIKEFEEPIVEELSKFTMKDIVIDGHKDLPSSSSYSRAVLTQQYEGKKPRYTFELGQQRYDTIIPLMKEVIQWLSETSECKNDNVLRVNMSFDNRHLKTLNTISHMNPQKLILKIDEEYIYQRFPEQDGSPYSMSIKQLLPLSEAQYTPDIIKNVNYIVGVPNKSYYGINFENYTKGILEFNYIGGYDYSEKPKEILEIIQYYVIKTYQSLNENEYTKDEVRELERLTDDYYKIHEAYYEPEKFNELFPDIKVAIDLRRDTQLLKSYWPQIRNTLFNSVINNGLTEGFFNLDTEYGVYQIKNGNLNCSKIDGFDLISCRINGVVENCNLIGCDISDARLYNSLLASGNEVFGSYLHRVTSKVKNSLEQCFVENHHELLNCDIKESVIKFAGIGSAAKLDEATVIIDEVKEIKPAVGVEVEELRDYKWLKDLTGKHPEGHTFGNEYIKKTYI
jgi:hypothetical protein